MTPLLPPLNNGLEEGVGVFILGHLAKLAHHFIIHRTCTFYREAVTVQAALRHLYTQQAYPVERELNGQLRSLKQYKHTHTHTIATVGL